VIHQLVVPFNPSIDNKLDQKYIIIQILWFVVFK